MIDIESWMHEFVVKVKNLFSERLCFVGLQGSYQRGDANDKSGIDLVVIVDDLDFEDLKNYQEMLDTLTNKKSICGFIAGREEFKKWDKGDLFMFFYDTKAYVNEISDIIPTPTKEDAIRFIKASSCNILHVTTQNYLITQNAGTIVSIYKTALSLLRAKKFVDDGVFYSDALELKSKLSRDDLVVFTIANKLRTATEMTVQEFADDEIIMFEWASNIISEYN